ncbi:1-acyl-sn-glycerol-3-phosphate acyltransferase [Leptothoe sp. PORK10 BA2]|uniref:1-acyl-sn-glycerol-3-phosphate acyltransferase n=1 Tax=Leptothoe sp. PORK10 BA2 TaxID=3110254 RepID=UPI002B21F7A4|nr:1-acyl-sn-glycerol-3-phosphate acyltransferase [Leptothoe sp. PORK10 BA2]MEA5466630.1 1-acyl-sn-glycerol-3-phosphate acyltransferase [Leptothoe sp. PORK10 BA2]
MAPETTLFFPPKQKPLLIRLVQSVSYLVLQRLYQCGLVVSEDDVAKLRAMAGTRVVYVCNHPTMEDGMVLFSLAARVGQLWHYVVAKESFRGFQGRFLQWMGCYSIRRGLGDRASIAQTLSLLKTPQAQVVIFPEGGCSYQNGTVMPFRPGAIQMPLQVIAQLTKQDPNTDLYVVPISLKYRYTQPMTAIIEDTLQGLEQALGIMAAEAGEPRTFYSRLLAIAGRVLARLETEYGLANQPEQDWNPRIDRLRNHVIARCEQQLDLPSNGTTIRERVYKIQALLETEEPKTIAEDDALYWTTVRLLNFDAIYDGYVADDPTPERFLDTLMRLEREVYQVEHIQPKAHRQAIFRVGEPINLKHYVADFRRDKAGTVGQLTEQLRQGVQTNLI